MQPPRIHHVVNPPDPPSRRAVHWHRRDLRRVAAVTLAVAAALFTLAWAGWLNCGLHGCPPVDTLTSYSPDGAPVLLDRDGEPFAELKPAGHEVVELEGLPEYVPEAFIAVEDRRFRRHGGVDFRRVGGALLANLRARDIEEGSSTVTMQLARNVFPDRLPAQRRTIGRKLLEMRVARKIEGRFDKEEILELYLNYIYFGGGARGIAAASRLYFDKAPRELTLAEAALLAALPKAPTHYDPRRHPERARERRDLVLGLMADQERVSRDEADEARQEGLGVGRQRRAPRSEVAVAPYFVEQVRQELEERFGDSIYSEPLRIRTTLDTGAQQAAEEELERQLAAIESGAWGRFRGARYDPGAKIPEGSTDYLQGAVVVISAESGDVLAWVGGRDFFHSRFDRVEDARRQVGSAFKPFVYATALAQGHPLSEQLVDQPLEIAMDRRRVWRPRNFGGSFEGRVSMRDALVRSKNVPTVRLAQQVGTNDIARTARELGLPGERVPRTPAMALGTASLSPLELATAYTPFATLGTRVEPRLVLEVEREDGEVLWSATAESRRVLDPAVAFLVTDVLADAIDRGTGTAVRRAGFRGPAAGKTGTTNDRRDTWFVGYTPEMVAAVWIGFDHPATIVLGAVGGRLAAPVWGRMMRRVYAGNATPADWTPPGDLARRAVDPATGLLLAEGCRPAAGSSLQEYFVMGTEPRSICPWGPLDGDGSPDWRDRFQAWLGSWGEENGDEGAEVVREGNVDIERLPDGRLIMENTGRGEEGMLEHGDPGSREPAPLERQPATYPPLPADPPVGPPAPPEEPGEDDGIDIRPLPTDRDPRDLPDAEPHPPRAELPPPAEGAEAPPPGGTDGGEAAGEAADEEGEEKGDDGGDDAEPPPAGPPVPR